MLDDTIPGTEHIIMAFAYCTTALTPVEQSLVPTPGYYPLLADEVPLAATQDGIRVYGYLEPTDGEAYGQIVRIQSEYDLERYAGRVSFAWESSATRPPIERA